MIIYSKKICPKCKLLKFSLKEKNIDFEEVRIDEEKNKDAKEKIANAGFSSLPIVEMPDGSFKTFEEMKTSILK